MKAFASYGKATADSPEGNDRKNGKGNSNRKGKDNGKDNGKSNGKRYGDCRSLVTFMICCRSRGFFGWFEVWDGWFDF